MTALSIPAVFFDTSLFSYHPSLMSLGFLLFLAEVCVFAGNHNSKFSALQRDALAPSQPCCAQGVVSGLKLRNVMPAAVRLRHAQLFAVCLYVTLSLLLQFEQIHPSAARTELVESVLAAEQHQLLRMSGVVRVGWRLS